MDGSLNCPEALGRIKMLLGGASGGEIPRRAVLCRDGRIAERVSHPDRPEIVALSTMCDILRKAYGLQTHSRDPATLFRECLDFNTPSAWQALYMDIRTGDVDEKDIRSFFEDNSRDASGMITALLASRDSAHAIGILCAIAAAVPEVPDAARQAIADALATNLAECVDSFARHGRSLPSKYRDSLMTSLGKLLSLSGISSDVTTIILDDALENSPGKADLLMRAMIHAPLERCRDIRPEVVGKIVQRAMAAPPAKRYSPLVLLTRIFRDDPDALVGLEIAVGELAAASLEDLSKFGTSLDARAVLASAMLARRVLAHDHQPNVLERLALPLAVTLEQCAAALVRAASGN